MVFTGHGWSLADGSAAPRGIEQLLFRMRGLKTIGNVLHVGTHPDDEDAGLMAYVTRKYAARAVYWSATRGEAGQNRIGTYSGEALGIYRTWESLDARAIDGGESIFGPFYDFGYCTSGDQAVARWGRRELLREVVRAIRLVQPQILVARFTGTPADGHGQHQAIGAATTEAFDLARDPTCFPELRLPAWRTAKLYQSTGGDWQPGEEHSLGQLQPAFERDGYLRIDTGQHDPVAGATYQQMAWAAFNCHRTQAMGFVPDRGRFFYYYKLAKSLVDMVPREESFYDGLDSTLVGLVDYPGGAAAGARATLQAICNRIDAALLLVRPDDASEAVAPLVEGLEMLRRLRASNGTDQALIRHLDYKIARFEEVIVGCLGVDAECTASRTHVAAGERVRIRGQWWNLRGLPVDELTLRLIAPKGWHVAPVSIEDSKTEIEYDVTVAEDAPVTAPSWLRQPHDGNRYDVPIETFACEALDATTVTLECEFAVSGQRLALRRPAVRREPFAGGYRELPLSVLPAVSVTPQRGRIFLPAGPDPRQLDVHAAVHRHVEQSGMVRLLVHGPEGWIVDPPAVEVPVAQPDEVALARFVVTVPGDRTAGKYRLSFVHGSDEHQPAVTFEPVWMGAPGLPRLPDAATCVREAFLATPAQVDVHVIGAAFVRGVKYGYIRGAAEGMLQALEDLGLDITAIGDEEMSFLQLQDYDAIVVGPNAYLLRDELRRNAGRFLDYVAAGGTLIVQYQAYGYELQQSAPYPFDYSHPHDRITSPDAPVVVLEPQHALMTYPNRISDKDFAGWTHDRGLYFFGRFDERFTPILECSESGEAPKRGGLLVAAHGRGAFVYVGYSLFRQIPAAVPGAFRLLANILALPEALLLERVERLRTLSLFSFMTDAQLMAVARIVSETYRSAGEYLCRQGELGQELFIIVKGDVEIIRQTDSGPVRFENARDGQVVGEFAILADIPRTADLRALTNLHLMVISSVHFRALIREHAEIAENVIRQLVMKLIVQ